MSKTLNARPKIVVVLGPTASGKSALGVVLARKFGGEVISADSRQVYRGMNIGTGKITKREMRGIPHHLLNVASPQKNFTVAEYQKLGKAAISKIVAKGKLPIIVGGTGFYIDSLIYGYNLPEVPPNPKLRGTLDKKSTEGLFAELKSLDPKRAVTIDPRNKRRLIRALEILAAIKKPIPGTDDVLKQESEYHVLKIGLKIDPKKLKEKIGTRLATRLKQGMIGEVKKLHKRGLSWQRLDDLGLEYRFVSRYLRKTGGDPSTQARNARTQQVRTEMAELLRRAIWKYYKRQMTWFKKDKKIRWVSTKRTAESLVRKFIKRPPP